MRIKELITSNLPSLSSGQRKVAEYILNNLNTFSYSTLNKLSKEISVSETTIIRLSYSLGFESFSQMQNTVQKEILSSQEMKAETNADTDNFFQQKISYKLSQISGWAAKINEENLNSIIDSLLHADKTLILGARSSATAASWFGSILNRLLGNTEIISAFYDPRFELISDTTPNTVVFCITFARYTRWTYQYTEILKKRGAQIIAITDSALSPILTIADKSVLVDSNVDEMGFNSFTCLYCLFDMIISKIQKERHSQISARLRDMEETLSSLDIFYE